jgi:hypothetical protein
LERLSYAQQVEMIFASGVRHVKHKPVAASTRRTTDSNDRSCASLIKSIMTRHNVVALTRLSGLPPLGTIFLDLDENVRQRPTHAPTPLTDSISKGRYLQELQVFTANYGMCGAFTAVKGVKGIQ